MNMEFKTKVRTQGNSLITTVPHPFANLFNVEKGTVMCWKYDSENPEKIMIDIVKE